MGGHRCQVSCLALEPLLERPRLTASPSIRLVLWLSWPLRAPGVAGTVGRQGMWGWYFLPQALARVDAWSSAPLGTLPQVTHPGLSVLPW